MLRDVGPRPCAPLRRAAPGLVALALATLLTACGGGSGGAQSPLLPTDLGTLSSTAPTVTTQPFASPLPGAVTVSLVNQTGPFAILGGALPATATGTAQLPLVFTPTGPGAFAGSVELSFDDGTTVQTRTFMFVATAEAITFTVSPPVLAYGTVGAGSSLDRDITVRNTSTVSALALSSATLPSARFTLLANPLPLSLAAGDAVTLTMRYAPPTVQNDDGTFLLTTGGGIPSISVPVTAGTNDNGSEEVHDFGAQAFTGNNMTDQLAVDVPADAVSLSIEAVGAEGDTLGLGELIGPNGRVFENTQLTGNYIWFPGTHAFNTTVPNTDKANVQMDGAGIYLLRVVRLSGSSPSANVRVIVERRAPGHEVVATLPLNVWLANGLSVDAASAANDTNLQNILARVDAILSGRGIRLGAITYYDVADPAFDDVTSDAEFDELLKLTSAASEERLNLFFVNTALGGGIVGVSATVAGPKALGTIVSGVMSIYSNDADFVGLVAAHEIGHFCGLEHTAEQNGTYDNLDDTLECPADGSTNGTCTAPGGDYLMHWSALGGVDLTFWQGTILRAHPLMEPGVLPGGSPKPTPRLPPLGPATLKALRALPATWCGTCRDATGPKAR